jgi:hypothetical protein
VGGWAQTASVASEAALLQRLKNLKDGYHRLLGWGEPQLAAVKQFIRERATIIIHFDPLKTLNKLVNDTHYRNQFETGTSGGLMDTKQRKLWEDALFNGAYNDAKDVDRPKYGALNMSHDPHGIGTRCSQVLLHALDKT